MKMTEKNLTAGIAERRPSASRIPSGREVTMPTVATTMVTRSPPHSAVSTVGSHLGIELVRWRSACNHRIGIAAFNDAVSVANAVSTAGAGCSCGLVRSACMVLDADLAGSKVHDGSRNKEWRDLAWAAGKHGTVFALDDVESTNAGADVHPDAIGNIRRDI